jgi:hypothetical protein
MNLWDDDHGRCEVAAAFASGDFTVRLLGTLTRRTFVRAVGVAGSNPRPSYNLRRNAPDCDIYVTGWPTHLGLAGHLPRGVVSRGVVSSRWTVC